jgi:hypothetical protein
MAQKTDWPTVYRVEERPRLGIRNPDWRGSFCGAAKAGKGWERPQYESCFDKWLRSLSFHHDLVRDELPLWAR